MPLEDLTLADICALDRRIQAALRIGRVLPDARFGLAEPGRVVVLLDGEAQEKLGGDGGGLQRLCPAEYDRLQAGGGVSPSPAEAPPEAEPVVPADGQRHPASAFFAGVTLQEPELPRDEAAPCAEPEPVAPIVAEPADAAPPVASQVPPRWTPQEDDRLIETVARLVCAGHSRAGAIASAAQMIGRPFEGTHFRVYKILKGRLDEAILEASRHQAPGQETSEPVAPAGEAEDPRPAPVAAAVPAGAGEQLAPAVPDDPAALLSGRGEPDDELGRHLWTLTRKGGWDFGADHRLMDLACLGWRLPDIAGEMGRPDLEVKRRFDLLVKNRAFKREAVRDRLAAFLALAEAAE